MKDSTSERSVNAGACAGWVMRHLAPPMRGAGLLQDTAWNALMNGALAGLTFFALALASRWTGAYWCGVMVLGLAMAQQLFTLGNFAMQGYQASDVEERRPFSAYLGAKILTVGAMLVAGGAWLRLSGATWDKAMVFLPLLLFYASDAFGLAFFARYWQKGRLDAACRVRFAKLMAFAGTYTAVLWATRNPMSALWAGAVVHIGLFFALDIPLMREFGPLEWRWPGRASLTILAACTPLAANSFLAMYVNNGPRFAVDAVLGEETLAAYGALFMVSFAVAVCGDFLMNPQVVRLAEAVRRRDRTGAYKIVRRQSVIILVLGLAGLAAGAAVGIPVLSWLFGLDLNGLRMVLLILLCGGILLTFYQLGQIVLVVLRRQAWGMPGMALAAACVCVAARPMVGRWGMPGAAWCYFGAVALLAVCSGTAAVWFLRGALSPQEEAT